MGWGGGPGWCGEGQVVKVPAGVKRVWGGVGWRSRLVWRGSGGEGPGWCEEGLGWGGVEVPAGVERVG